MARYRIKKIQYKFQPSKYIIEKYTLVGLSGGFPPKAIETWISISNKQFDSVEECESYIDRLHPVVNVIKELHYD